MARSVQYPLILLIVICSVVLGYYFLSQSSPQSTESTPSSTQSYPLQIRVKDEFTDTFLHTLEITNTDSLEYYLRDIDFYNSVGLADQNSTARYAPKSLIILLTNMRLDNNVFENIGNTGEVLLEINTKAGEESLIEIYIDQEYANSLSAQDISRVFSTAIIRGAYFLRYSYIEDLTSSYNLQNKIDRYLSTDDVLVEFVKK